MVTADGTAVIARDPPSCSGTRSTPERGNRRARGEREGPGDASRAASVTAGRSEQDVGGRRHQAGSVGGGNGMPEVGVATGVPPAEAVLAGLDDQQRAAAL